MHNRKLAHHTSTGGRKASELAVKRGKSARTCFTTLQKGLYLEDRRILLPWGARECDLSEKCAPDRFIKAISWKDYNWDNPVMFAGLNVRLLQAVVYPYGWLDSAWAWLERGHCLETAEAQFEAAFDHLAGIFGLPITPWGVSPACPSMLRSAAWDWGDMRLNLLLQPAESFQDHSYACSAHIAHRSCAR
jgi:hypothetical protein